MKNRKLYRPVGVKEHELIKTSGMKSYPPRLSWQPIFYPVLNFEYAAQIAKEWNTEDEDLVLQVLLLVLKFPKNIFRHSKLKMWEVASTKKFGFLLNNWMSLMKK